MLFINSWRIFHNRETSHVCVSKRESQAKKENNANQGRTRWHDGELTLYLDDINRQE
jgi:hypothetical protein